MLKSFGIKHKPISTGNSQSNAVLECVQNVMAQQMRSQIWWPWILQVQLIDSKQSRPISLLWSSGLSTAPSTLCFKSILDSWHSVVTQFSLQDLQLIGKCNNKDSNSRLTPTTFANIAIASITTFRLAILSWFAPKSKENLASQLVDHFCSQQWAAGCQWLCGAQAQSHSPNGLHLPSSAFHSSTQLRMWMSWPVWPWRSRGELLNPTKSLKESSKETSRRNKSIKQVRIR